MQREKEEGKMQDKSNKNQYLASWNNSFEFWCLSDW